MDELGLVNSVRPDPVPDPDVVTRDRARLRAAIGGDASPAPVADLARGPAESRHSHRVRRGIALVAAAAAVVVVGIVAGQLRSTGSDDTVAGTTTTDEPPPLVDPAETLVTDSRTASSPSDIAVCDGRPAQHTIYDLFEALADSTGPRASAREALADLLASNADLLAQIGYVEWRLPDGSMTYVSEDSGIAIVVEVRESDDGWLATSFVVATCRPQ